MAAREGSARRFATNAMLGSVIGAKLSASGAWMFHGGPKTNTQPGCVGGP
jgi:hypothetical protein